MPASLSHFAGGQSWRRVLLRSVAQTVLLWDDRQD